MVLDVVGLAPQVVCVNVTEVLWATPGIPLCSRVVNASLIAQGVPSVWTNPIFLREALTAPRQFRHYLFRIGFLGALFVLFYTATQVTFGFQLVRNYSELARFGERVFQLFSLIQLLLVLFFSVLFSAGNVAQEKDRRTLVLLLMTDLRDTELVLGKLFASLLAPLMLVALTSPALALIYALGGFAWQQAVWVMLVTAAAALAAGAWGTLVAFWREKTFQTLAICLMGMMLWVAIMEVTISTMPGHFRWLSWFNPLRVILDVLHPLNSPSWKLLCGQCVLAQCGLAIVLITITVAKLRWWNPSRAITEARTLSAAEVERTRPPRLVWDMPILWREMCTRAYGRKVILIKAAYLFFAAGLAAWLESTADPSALWLGMIPPAGVAWLLMSLTGLMLVNAQAVTALTSERDVNTLELLLVTEISAREFVLSKLGGVLYNCKEMLITPICYLGWIWSRGLLGWESLFYLCVGYVVLVLFAAMLGLHFGLTYGNSRQAIANSLATMFFLFVGIFLLMILIVQARSSFAVQLPSFLVFILGGSLMLGAILTHRNPSPALWLSSALLPFCTFYAITSYLLGQTLGVCLFLSGAYGFTTIAMLVPAISEFDVALGRSTLDQG